jgi:PKD domain
MKTLLTTLFAALAFAALPAAAQTLQSVKAEPASAKPGEPVTITAAFDISNGLNCNVRFHFGDGASQDQKVNQEKDANLSVQHSYAKPGSYTVKVQPRIAMPAFKCLGKDQTAVVTVAAPAAAPAAAGPAAPSCPAGWALQAKSVNKKTGAYTCAAKAGTAAPAARPACPGSLTYFENTKKGQLGCRK